MNGWLNQYGASSFHHQCVAAFGDIKGSIFYELVNNVFDCMPVAAVISDQVFCCHGGIPDASTYKEYGSIEQVTWLLSQASVSKHITDDLPQLLECLPRGKGAQSAYNLQLFHLVAHDCAGCATGTARPPIEALSNAATILCAPDDVWTTARWKGCDPGPVEGLNWPSLDHQKQFDATALKRWRALRAAHDIMWGDPLTAAFAADARIKRLLPLLPNGILRRHQDPYKTTTRVLQYTKEAVEDFLNHHGFTRVVRGHQGKGAGAGALAC